MKYCSNCVLPDTRPNLALNAEGVCNACEAHQTRKVIDWPKRQKIFREVVRNAQRRSRGYDCLIPVSGGKDSTWQVVTCLEYGLHPLAVTWKAPLRTELGQKNLTNLINLGVDHIDYQVNPKVERKFLYQALVKYGTPATPMHLSLFNIPFTLAVKYKIPLVVWGENSAFEYGGTKEERVGFKLDGRWRKKYGVSHGTSAKDWISKDLTQKELTPYFGPSDRELEAAGVLAVFLGYYFPWDPTTSLKTAVAHGFQVRAEGPKTGLYNYADIDDDLISVHHYLKWYKFGFTRLFDNLSIEIRNGRITRLQAIQIIREKGEQRPDEDIETFCTFVGISRKKFFAIIEKFRNLSIWTKKNGTWRIKDFLLPDWTWT